jgi:hypothetical protein
MDQISPSAQADTRSEHILVINRFADRDAEYDRYIDHDQYRVAYITTRTGAEFLDADRAEIVVIVDDLSDRDVVLAHGKMIHAQFGDIDHLVCLSEFDLDIGGWLRDELGIPGPGITEIDRVRDKVTMKQLVSAAGLRVPRWELVESADATRRFATSVGYPVILKPRRGWDSQGVFLIRTQDALTAVLDGKDLTDYECEEFISGAMYHIDGIAQNGTIQVLRSARMTSSCLDFALGVPSGSVATDDGLLEERFRHFTQRVIRALGIRTSAFHLEVFRCQDEVAAVLGTMGPNVDDIVFLEIGARVGGAQIPNVWREVYGIDLVETWVRMLLGEDPCLPSVSADTEVGGYLLIPEPPVRPCRVAEVSSLIGRIPEVYAETLPEQGAVLDGSGGGTDTAGQFRLRGNTSCAVENAIRRVVSEYRLEWQSLNGPARPPNAARRTQARKCR